MCAQLIRRVQDSLCWLAGLAPRMCQPMPGPRAIPGRWRWWRTGRRTATLGCIAMHQADQVLRRYPTSCVLSPTSLWNGRHG